MIAWTLLVGVLLVAVLHRLDLAVAPTARSGARAGEPRCDLDLTSDDELAALGLPDPGHLAIPTTSSLAARTRPHRRTPALSRWTLSSRGGSFPGTSD